nr:2'-5' RNA ligase family protein [Clostridium muellerianum]
MDDQILKFHEKIRNDVCTKFNKKPQKLPAHFTIKAPFETEEIDDMLEVLDEFSKVRKKAPIKVEGFGKFREDVVYMNINLSYEAKKIHDELIDELAKIPWIEFKSNEGKNKTFHCTIVSKRIKDKFKEIWEYVNQYECSFENYFDNISLYKWENNTWKLYKEFKL